jgi:hypothetical protein
VNACMCLCVFVCEKCDWLRWMTEQQRASLTRFVALFRVLSRTRQESLRHSFILGEAIVVDNGGLWQLSP